MRGCGVVQVSYSGANVVRENDGDWWYVAGPGVDDPVLVVKRGVTQAWYPVLTDGQGTLLALADSTGQLQGMVLGPQYDAGIWNSTGLTGQAHSFNPRRQATPGGIDTISSFRTRQYDPGTGNWLQEDHAGLAGGVNLYEYDGNDPNSFGDPFGLAPDGCHGVIACFVALGSMELRGFVAGLDLSRVALSPDEGGAGFLAGRIVAGVTVGGGSILAERGGVAAADAAGVVEGTAPSVGMIRQFSSQLSEQGSVSVQRSIRSLERRLSEHLVKLDAINARGGNPASVEREISNFRRQIQAAKTVLNGSTT